MRSRIRIHISSSLAKRQAAVRYAPILKRYQAADHSQAADLLVVDMGHLPEDPNQWNELRDLCGRFRGRTLLFSEQPESSAASSDACLGGESQRDGPCGVAAASVGLAVSADERKERLLDSLAEAWGSHPRIHATFNDLLIAIVRWAEYFAPTPSVAPDVRERYYDLVAEVAVDFRRAIDVSYATPRPPRGDGPRTEDPGAHREADSIEEC